ncbi:uncharacterized protein G2W53_032678 [Senna tora]|uniref:Uncharacterized protein n=1 Tax=Senna tora TaxID=362788 RepID=A0A834W763_9FABA|nr:uncharacterized protein G2W53_032678 [Senna tora]
MCPRVMVPRGSTATTAGMHRRRMGGAIGLKISPRCSDPCPMRHYRF